MPSMTVIVMLEIEQLRLEIGRGLAREGIVVVTVGTILSGLLRRFRGCSLFVQTSSPSLTIRSHFVPR